jgi:hypothetical protein
VKSVTISRLKLVVKTRPSVHLAFVILLAFTAGVWAEQKLSSSEVRQLIAQVGGIRLSPEDVHIRRVDPGLGGRDVIVEALVQTAFNMNRQNGQWVITQVRTGDRQWESVELVATAVEAEKIKRTKADMQELAQAIERYRSRQNEYPKVKEFSALIDVLLAHQLARIIREDYWHQSYVYAPGPNGYQVRSLGPDRKQGTRDDIVFENGELISPAIGQE